MNPETSADRTLWVSWHFAVYASSDFGCRTKARRLSVWQSSWLCFCRPPASTHKPLLNKSAALPSGCTHATPCRAVISDSISRAISSNMYFNAIPACSQVACLDRLARRNSSTCFHVSFMEGEGGWNRRFHPSQAPRCLSIASRTLTAETFPSHWPSHSQRTTFSSHFLRLAAQSRDDGDL